MKQSENTGKTQTAVASKTQPNTVLPEAHVRKNWELLTVKYFQILLDYNLFQYGGKGELLK